MKDEDDPSTTISNFDPLASLFKEEDSNIFTECLKLYYDFFIMLNESFTSLFSKGREHMKIFLNDFTFNFQKYFFLSDVCKYYS